MSRNLRRIRRDVNSYIPRDYRVREIPRKSKYLDCRNSTLAQRVTDLECDLIGINSKLEDQIYYNRYHDYIYDDRLDCPESRIYYPDYEYYSDYPYRCNYYNYYGEYDSYSPNDIKKKRKKKSESLEEIKPEKQCCQVKQTCCNNNLEQPYNQEIIIRTVENCCDNNITIKDCGNCKETICLDISSDNEDSIKECIKEPLEQDVCNVEPQINCIDEQFGNIDYMSKTTLINQSPNFNNCKVNRYWSTKTYGYNSLGLIATDSDNNIIVSCQSNDNLISYIEKYDSQGKFMWYTYILSDEKLITNGITVDYSNNILITGTYSSPIKIYNCNKVVSIIPNLQNGINSFVIRYNPNGTLINSNVIASSNDVSSYNIISDYHSNYYVTGNFATCIEIYNSNMSIGGNLEGVNDQVFLIKFDNLGIFSWAVNIGSDDACYKINLARSIAFSSDDTIVIVGSYICPILYISNSNNQKSNITLTNDDNLNNSFIIKYSSSGKVIWASKISGNSIATSVTIDSNYSIIVSGEFTNCINIYGSTNYSPYFSLQNQENKANTFLVKYNSSGIPLWASSTNGNQEGSYNITTDKQDNIYSIISFKNNAKIFVGGNYYSLEENLSSQVSIIIKYNPQGNIVWNVKECDSVNDYFGIILDSNSNVIIVGNYTNKDISYMIKYYQYGQELCLEKPICETNKTLILNQYCGINTLINLNQPFLNSFIPSAILLTQQSTIVLLWTNCNWNIINNYNGIVIENDENKLV